MAGLVAGLLAAVAGAIDMVFVRHPGARRLGVLRSLLNMGVLIIFMVILMLRMQAPDRVVGGGLFAVELLALAVAGYGAWFGGQIATGHPPAFARALAGNRN